MDRSARIASRSACAVSYTRRPPASRRSGFIRRASSTCCENRSRTETASAALSATASEPVNWTWVNSSNAALRLRSKSVVSRFVPGSARLRRLMTEARSASHSLMAAMNLAYTSRRSVRTCWATISCCSLSCWRCRTSCQSSAAPPMAVAITRSQDIPGVSMSSGGVRLRDVFPVAPGDGLVVAGAGLEAAVQDADQAAGQVPQGLVVRASPGALGVVEGTGAG